MIIFKSKSFYILFQMAAIAVLVSAQSCGNKTFEESPASQPYQYITAKPVAEKVPLSPDKIIDWRWKNPKADDELEIYTLKPVTVVTDSPGSFNKLSSLTRKSSRALVRGKGTIMMDFGQVNAAWLEFDSKDLYGDVTMSISEYNESAKLNKGAQNRIKTLSPVKYGNTYRLELNDELYEGVRFGWIHVNTFEKEWHIDHVRLVCQVKPVNYMGSFSCSDSLLTKIWYTGAYGVKLNLLKDYFGAILMERSDRHSWTGDAYPSQAASLVAFANYDFIKKNIHHTSTQNNGIESYSLYWIQSLIDYFYYTGDTQTILHFIDNACEKLDHAYDIYGKKAPLRYYGWDERLGPGFLNFNNKNYQNNEVESAFKMLSIESWNDFSRVLNDLGETELSKKYSGFVAEKMREIRREKDWTEKFGVHAASDAINTGILNQDEKDKLYKKTFTDRLNRLSFSPFNQYFIIQALAGLNRYDDALETIRDQWGGQIKYGATTFFECFRPSWSADLNPNDPPPNGQCGYTSMAHPWGGGVVKWLSEEILGVKPLAPGFRSVNILPHLGRTLTGVEGKVQTPHGAIHVACDVNKGLAKIVIPHGIEANIGVPKVEKKILSIQLNGKKVWDDGKAIYTENKIEETPEFILFSECDGGTYSFEIEYVGETPNYVASKWVYPAAFVGQDSITQGNWYSSYGNEGYVLFNYTKKNDKKAHVQSLKGDIVDVAIDLNADSIWGIHLNDERVLVPENKEALKWNAGFIATRDPRACWQTMTIDVQLAQQNEYEFSLYFLDWDKQKRRTAIEVFDLQTRNIIAPVKIVDNYSGGKYMTYCYNNSVRFRINHVRGPNAVVSGIFFDKVTH